MKKEVIWAIIGGITFGLVLAIGIYRINKRINQANKNNFEVKNTPRAATKEFKIALIKPENYEVVTEANLKIEGLTKPNSTIIISTDSNDYITKSDEVGNFTDDIKLIGGVNQIKVTAFDTNLAKSEESSIVVYSSSFQKIETDEIKPENNSTESAIRAKVQEKVNALLNKPKSYLGIVTDITDTSIEIKSKQSEIKQISLTSTNISVVKTFPTNKDVKITDIAIGDWIAALGYKDENEVLDAQRILIITEPKPLSDEIILGTVSKATKTSLFIGDIEYIFDKTVNIKPSSIKPGQKIIAVGKRSIFVLE